MIRKLLVLTTLVGMLGATPTLAAHQCRDAKGKFIKCSEPAKKAPALSRGAMTKDKSGKCRFTSGPKKGQFTKCK